MRAAESDEGLKKLRAAKLERLKTAINCRPELTCFAQAMVWTTEEIGAAESSLRALERTSKLFRESVSVPMRTSGLYQLHSKLNDAAGINRAIAIYGEGAAPVGFQ